MNLLRKLTELSLLRYVLRQLRLDISKKDLVDFCLLTLICFMIVVYKINNASAFVHQYSQTRNIRENSTS